MLALLWLVLQAATNAPPACAVQVAPRLALAPVQFVRTKVTIERGARLARLELHGPNGLERASDLQVDARTQWVEWKSIVLEPGEYEVVLLVNTGCVARDRLTVA